MIPRDDDSQRWKLTIAYDGQPYEGWQSQPSGNTIQDLLENALAQFNGLPQGTRIHGSGRTDAGVHADGQVAHFDAPKHLTLDENAWPRALNARLPASIRVLRAEIVPGDFHARFSAVAKTYIYKVYIGNILLPMLAGRFHHVPFPIDIDALLRSANILQGRHDFHAFAANRGPGCPPPRTTIRTLSDITLLRPQADQVFLRFTADGFLYRMVRLLVGTMLQFAQGKLVEDDLKRFFEGPSTLKTSACAPADGLYLTEVVYPLNPTDPSFPHIARRC